MYALSTSGIDHRHVPAGRGADPRDRDAAHDARDRPASWPWPPRRCSAAATSPCPALIGAVALVPPGAVKPGSHIIYEGESAYQFVQVQSLPGGGRVLHLNEGWADHSVYRPGQVLTGGYWDQFLLAPVLHGPGVSEPQHDRLRRRDGWTRLRHLLAVGQRARHRARPAGHRCRDAGTSGSPTTRASGWRPPTAASTWSSTTRATTRLPRRLPPALHPVLPDDAGVLGPGPRPARCRRHGDGQRRPHPERRPACPDAIAGTMATRFASVFEWRVSGFNDIVAGFTSPTTAAELRARLAAAPRGAPARRRRSRSSSGWSPPQTIL